MPPKPTAKSGHSPLLAAVAGWIIPGGGYLVIGQFTRGIVVGLCVLLMFGGGLLIGGIRCLEVPGYNAHGNKMYWYVERIGSDRPGYYRLHPHLSADPPDLENPRFSEFGWVLWRRPMDEIRSKPWNVAQILAGPIDLLCDWLAISAARLVPRTPTNAAPWVSAPLAPRSHARVNELGVLYTGVAGMLNLLAIIDSSYRAGRSETA